MACEIRTCLECGIEIPRKRIDAVSDATRCKSCEEKAPIVRPKVPVTALAFGELDYPEGLIAHLAR